MHKVLIILFFILDALIAKSQDTCDYSNTLVARNSNFKALPFKSQVGFINKETGKEYGCGFQLGCFFATITIEKAIFNKNNSELELQGSCTFRMPTSYTIFLGQPAGNNRYPDTLENIRNVAELETPDEKGEDPSTYVLPKSFFKIKITVKKNDRLYFEAGQHNYMAEYNVGCLLK